MARAKTKKAGLPIKIPANAFKKGREEYKKNPKSMDDTEFPPGTYLGQLLKLVPVETEKGPQIIAKIKVASEDDDEIHGGVGSIWFSFDPERIVHLFRFLAKLGFEVDDLDDKVLAEIISELEDSDIVLKVSVNAKGFMKCKSVEDMEPSELGFDDEESEDEDDEDDEEEDEDEDEDGEEDELEGLSRADLKKLIKEEKLDITIKKSMTDEAIRNAIREEMEEEED